MKDKGGIYTIYQFFHFSNLRVEIFSKIGGNRKKVDGNKGLRHLCKFLSGFQENFMQSLSILFIGFFSVKK